MTCFAGMCMSTNVRSIWSYASNSAETSSGGFVTKDDESRSFRKALSSSFFQSRLKTVGSPSLGSVLAPVCGLDVNGFACFNCYRHKVMCAAEAGIFVYLVPCRFGGGCTCAFHRFDKVGGGVCIRHGNIPSQWLTALPWN